MNLSPSKCCGKEWKQEKGTGEYQKGSREKLKMLVNKVSCSECGKEYFLLR